MHGGRELPKRAAGSFGTCTGRGGHRGAGSPTRQAAIETLARACQTSSRSNIRQPRRCIHSTSNAVQPNSSRGGGSKELHSTGNLPQLWQEGAHVAPVHGPKQRAVLGVWPERTRAVELPQTAECTTSRPQRGDATAGGRCGRSGAFLVQLTVRARAVDQDQTRRQRRGHTRRRGGRAGRQRQCSCTVAPEHADGPRGRCRRSVHSS